MLPKMKNRGTKNGLPLNVCPRRIFNKQEAMISVGSSYVINFRNQTHPTTTIFKMKIEPDRDKTDLRYPCDTKGERRCEDGTCIPRVELCPEEQVMNQNTILVMIVVGLAVVMFLFFLYCFQQKQRRRSFGRSNSQNGGPRDGSGSDEDHASLYMPPPSYEEVISSNLYPPTPETLRQARMSVNSEPRTPPPNYDAALKILAQSHDCVILPKEESNKHLIRRSISLDHISVQTRSRQSDADSPTINEVFR